MVGRGRNSLRGPPKRQANPRRELVKLKLVRNEGNAVSVKKYDIPREAELSSANVLSAPDQFALRFCETALFSVRPDEGA